MDNLGYLFAVYGIVWLVLFIYIFTLVNNQKKLTREIQNLKEILKQKKSE
jgi:CcmD family protein